MTARRNQSAGAAATSDASLRAWSATARRLASAILVLHLAAMASAPAAIPPPTSGLSAMIHDWFHPYLAATCQDNGYRFFAPNPGPCHIVEYTLEYADGGRKQGHFPDLTEHWPRLLYHRHFMISERAYVLCSQMTTRDLPRRPPTFLQGEELRRAERQFAQAELEYRGWASNFQEVGPKATALLEGIAADLLRRHGARRVVLSLAEHEIPSDEDVRKGLSLADRSLYFSKELGSLTAGETWSWAEDFRGPGAELLP